MKASTLFSLIFLLLTGACPRGPAPHAHAQPRAATRATLRGRVVYADTGNPVRRAEVALLSAETGERVGGAVTNVKGEFNIKSVAAGRYTLAAVAPGLVEPDALYRPPDAADALDLAEEQSGLTEVEVDGTSDADVLIRARRGGAITGRVTAEDGEPLAGAQVKLLRLWRGRLVRVGATWRSFSDENKYQTTDARGVYRIGGLPAGEYLVRASESDLKTHPSEAEGDAYGDGSLVVSYFPAAVAVKDAAPVRVYEGRDTDGVDVRLADRPARRVAGVVTLKGGGPVAAADITFDRKDEGPPRRGAFGEGSARTDAEGRWEVRGVPDGQYVVTVSSLSSLTRTAQGVRRTVLIVPARREVSVSGGDLTDVRVEVEEGGFIGGTVSVEGGGALPDFIRLDALRDGEQVDWDLVRGGGEFKLEKVPAGEVRLHIEDVPANRFYVKSITWNQVDLARAPLRIGERARVEGVRVVLSTDVATLDGQALSRREDATPLARAVVALVPADEKVRRATARPRVVRADARGRFKITGPPGEYLLVALAESSLQQQGIRLDEEYLRRALPAPTRVTLRAGGKVSGVKVYGGAE